MKAVLAAVLMLASGPRSPAEAVNGQASAALILDANHAAVGDPPASGAAEFDYSHTGSGLTGTAVTRIGTSQARAPMWRARTPRGSTRAAAMMARSPGSRTSRCPTSARRAATGSRWRSTPPIATPTSGGALTVVGRRWPMWAARRGRAGRWTTCRSRRGAVDASTPGSTPTPTCWRRSSTTGSSFTWLRPTAATVAKAG